MGIIQINDTYSADRFSKSFRLTKKAIDLRIEDIDIHTEKFKLQYERINEELGYSLGINEPYSGTIVSMEFYKKDERVQSIMLEVNRKLYLSGTEKSDGYEKIKEVVQGYLKVLKKT